MAKRRAARCVTTHNQEQAQQYNRWLAVEAAPAAKYATHQRVRQSTGMLKITVKNGKATPVTRNQSRQPRGFCLSTSCASELISSFGFGAGLYSISSGAEESEDGGAVDVFILC
jgi:hypothetical protein